MGYWSIDQWRRSIQGGRCSPHGGSSASSPTSKSDCISENVDDAPDNPFKDILVLFACVYPLLIFKLFFTWALSIVSSFSLVSVLQLVNLQDGMSICHYVFTLISIINRLCEIGDIIIIGLIVVLLRVLSVGILDFTRCVIRLFQTLQQCVADTITPHAPPSNYLRIKYTTPLHKIIYIIFVMNFTFLGSDGDDDDGGGKIPATNKKEDNKKRSSAASTTDASKKKRSTSTLNDDDDDSCAPDGASLDSGSDSDNELDSSDYYSSDEEAPPSDTFERDHVTTSSSFMGEVFSKIKFGWANLRSTSQTVQQRIGQIISSGSTTVEYMVVNGAVYIPGSSIEEKFNLAKIRMQTKETGGIYMIRPSGETVQLYDGKTGRSTNLRKRYEHSYEGRDTIIIFDFDYASKDVIEMLQGHLEEIKNMDGVNLDNVTIENLTMANVENMENEANSISIFPRLVLHSLFTSLDNVFGSARDATIEDDDLEEVNPLEDADNNDESTPERYYGIKGVERALLLNTAESLLYKFLKEMGVDSNDEAAQHEHLHFGPVSGFIKESDEEVEGSVLPAFFNALREAVGDDNWLFRQQHVFKCLSSWAPRILHQTSSATHLIYDALLGIPLSKSSERWNNVFAGTPNQNYGAYNSKDGYNSDDRENARDVHQSRLNEAKRQSGFHLIDVCSEAYRDCSDSFITRAEHEGYTQFFKYLHMTAFIYKSEEENVISVLIVHDPLCDIFRSSSNSWIPWYEVKRQSKKAITAHFLQAIITRLQTQDPDGDIDTFPTRKKIFGNFLFAYCMRVYMLRNLHVHSMVATLFGKNILCWHTNIFRPEYHDQMGSKHGITKKEQRESQRGEVAFTKDMQLQDKVLRLLSRIRSDSSDDFKTDIFDRIVAMFNVIPSKGENNERERHFGNQSDLLKSFKDDYLNENGEDVYQRMSNRVTTFYAGGVGSSRQAVVDAAVADAPSEADRELAKQNLRSSMAGFTL